MVYFYHLRIVATLVLLFFVREKRRSIDGFDSSQRIHGFLLLIHQHKVNILNMDQDHGSNQCPEFAIFRNFKAFELLVSEKFCEMLEKLFLSLKYR